jgi:hypothetical protein
MDISCKLIQHAIVGDDNWQNRLSTGFVSYEGSVLAMRHFKKGFHLDHPQQFCISCPFWGSL